MIKLAVQARHAEIASKVPSLGKEGSGGNIYFLVAIIGLEELTLCDNTGKKMASVRVLQRNRNNRSWIEM